MKKNITAIITLANLVAMSCAHAEGMCKAHEAETFTCEMQKSFSSLCESKDVGTLSCRSAVANKVNFEISESRAR
jgi:hypothetical protein